MEQKSGSGDQKAIFALSAMAGLIGSLCCVTPVVLVLFGLASVTVANNWGNLLYGEYRWWFRGVALLFLAAGLVVYFRRRGICTLDTVARQRNRVINVTLLVFLLATGIYVFGNYVVVHFWGIAAGLPWAQWDESWAYPVSAVLLGAAAIWLLLTWLLARRSAAIRRGMPNDRYQDASPPVSQDRR